MNDKFIVSHYENKLTNFLVYFNRNKDEFSKLVTAKHSEFCNEKSIYRKLIT